ncbi:hypothetical protein AB1Y20_000482 [Prymnesium parvum]|uniref:N(6)-L-threonylcarbamoyladenine synthase n=1 Tax=Prymnesium parvum TaxID=97485 RepID=A0AB34K832_PRYPA
MALPRSVSPLYNPSPPPECPAPRPHTSSTPPQPHRHVASMSGGAFTLTLDDEAATAHLGAQLAQVALAGDVIFLRGELGAGKTSLSRGYLRHFFGNPHLEVPSPSYLISFTYSEGTACAGAADDAAAGGGSRPVGRTLHATGAARLPGVNVLHLDPYRLPEGKVASLIDLQPAFERHICLIEWPERLGGELVSDRSPPRLELTLGGIGPQAQGRMVSLRAVGERWASQLEAWSAAGRVDVSLSVVEEGAGEGLGGGTVLEDDTAAGTPSGVFPRGEPREWLVLGIESSCDDTGAAVVRGDGTVLGEVLASQAGVHEGWGGVVPKLAQAAHAAAIDRTVDEALRISGVSPSDLSAVAVTVGPGLSLCLEVGVKKAVALAREHQLLLVRAHHMECHAMVTWLPTQPPPRVDLPVGGATAAAPKPAACEAPQAAAATPSSSAALDQKALAISQGIPTASTTLSPDGVPPFPFLTLLVSGGHNMLVLSSGLGRHSILGSTLDDSIGEAFDKTARLLGLQKVPGGPELEKLARDGDEHRHSLPAPLSRTRDEGLRASCDFSFSGLKSAVRMLIDTHLPAEKLAELNEEQKHAELAHIAASFQRVAVEHLAMRTARAIEWARAIEPDLSCVVVAGGVAANLRVRSELARVASDAGLAMVCPPLRLCTDNGVMVAWTGMQRLRLGLGERPLRLDAEADVVALCVEVRPRWPIGPRDRRSTTQQQQLSKRKQASQPSSGGQPNEQDRAKEGAGKQSRKRRLQVQAVDRGSEEVSEATTAGAHDS